MKTMKRISVRVVMIAGAALGIAGCGESLEAVDAGFDPPTVGNLREGAQLVWRGEPMRRWARLVIALDGVSTTEAGERTRWTIRTASGATPALDEASLVVFPRLDDVGLAAYAVWLVPAAEGSDVQSFEARFAGTRTQRDVDLDASDTDRLGLVTIEPVLLRNGDGSQGPSPSADELVAHMRGFAPFFARECNLELVVTAPVEVRQGAFGSFSHRKNIVTIDDDLTGPTGLPPLSLLVGNQLPGLVDAVDEVASSDRVRPRPVRAHLVKIAEGNPSAVAITPLFFHNEFQGIVDGHYVELGPATLFDPEAPFLDESVDPPGLLQELVGYPDLARLQSMYIGDDHVNAFGHELGHMLGLGHPGDSSLVDARESPDGWPNFMENGIDECVPGCEEQLYVTPMQCEVMLSGLTGFVGAGSP